MLLSEQAYKKIDREVAKYPADQKQSAVIFPQYVVEHFDDLAQILLDRFTALGTCHAESCGKALCIVEIMIAHPGERQVGKRHVVVGQSVEPDSIRRSINAASRRQDARLSTGRSRRMYRGRMYRE